MLYKDMAAFLSLQEKPNLKEKEQNTLYLNILVPALISCVTFFYYLGLIKTSAFLLIRIVFKD